VDASGPGGDPAPADRRAGAAPPDGSPCRHSGHGHDLHVHARLVDGLSAVIPYWLAWRFRFVSEAIGFVTIAGGLAVVARPVTSDAAGSCGPVAARLCGALAVLREDILEYAVDRPGIGWRWRMRASCRRSFVH
jgi:hypothetical protein